MGTNAPTKGATMLRDRTVDDLRGRASSLRDAALSAEDECVKLRQLQAAADFDRLVSEITPVLVAEPGEAVASRAPDSPSDLWMLQQ